MPWKILKRREELISRTLVFAEKTKADIIGNARKEAENIIHEAELKAKRVIQETKQYLKCVGSPIHAPQGTETPVPHAVPGGASDLLWIASAKTPCSPRMPNRCWIANSNASKKRFSPRSGNPQNPIHPRSEAK